jgi:hypothetical protein
MNETKLFSESCSDESHSCTIFRLGIVEDASKKTLVGENSQDGKVESEPAARFIVLATAQLNFPGLWRRGDVGLALVRVRKPPSSPSSPPSAGAAAHSHQQLERIESLADTQRKQFEAQQLQADSAALSARNEWKRTNALQLRHIVK